MMFLRLPLAGVSQHGIRISVATISSRKVTPSDVVHGKTGLHPMAQPQNGMLSRLKSDFTPWELHPIRITSCWVDMAMARWSNLSLYERSNTHWWYQCFSYISIVYSMSGDISIVDCWWISPFSTYISWVSLHGGWSRSEKYSSLSLHKLVKYLHCIPMISPLVLLFPLYSKIISKNRPR